MNDEVDIYLVDLKNADMIRFPMLPESISVEAATRFASYDIMNIGEIKTPLGEELTTFSWEGILPGKMREKEPYVRLWSNPKSIQEKWSYYRVNGSRLQLIVTGTPIDHKVYLEEYSMEYSGGFGDYKYSIKFSHLKDLKISTESPKPPKTTPPQSEETVGTGKIKAKQNRPSKPEDGFYIVKGGDSLWKIAESTLGGGSRYGEIASLNGISNPQMLKPGQKLNLPKK